MQETESRLVKRRLFGEVQAYSGRGGENFRSRGHNFNGTLLCPRPYGTITEPTVTDTTHPSYPSPTIQEALCEIRFPVGPEQFPAQFSRVWDRLRDDFPQMETYVDVLPPPAANVILNGPLPTQPRFVLRHKTRQFLLQFIPGAFTLNTLSPYLGWQTMREDIERAWQSVQEILAPPFLTNVSVRYVNRIPLAADNTHGWLEAGGYLPATVVNAVPPFQFRVQTGTGTPSVTTLTIGPPLGPGEPDPVMLVDIERNLIGEFSAETAKIMAQADALHEDVWDIFKAIKGPRWNDILEGRAQ